MNITVLGSTGPTGQQIVRQALAAGFDVTALSRREFPFAHPNLRVNRGDVVDTEFVLEASREADAILSSLGSHDMKHKTTLYSASATAVVTAAHQSGVFRFICISAAPVTPEEQKPLLNRYILDPILRAFFGGGYEDMRRMEKVLCSSSLEWTAFRPPYLLNRPARGRYRIAIDAPVPHAYTLTRADLAAAMLAAVGHPTTIRHAVNIAN